MKNEDEIGRILGINTNLLNAEAICERIKTLQQAAEDILRLLEKREYVIDYGVNKKYCFVCEEDEDVGHTKDCALQKAKERLVKELRAEAPPMVSPSDRILECELHHPWCNYFMRPRKGCTMCDGYDGNNGLFAKYPLEEGMSTNDLMIKHFPENISRNPPK